MKIGILGHFARNTDMCDGQTVKTRNLEKALLNGDAEISTVDSYQWKKHPFKFLFQIIRLVRKSDVLIMLPDAGGIKVYPYVVNLFAKKKTMKIYSIVGAWLPSYLRRNKSVRKQLQKFTYLLPETQTMKTQLEEQGFDNVVIVPNFKDIIPLSEEEIQHEHSKPYKFCIFSRVMKEKGVNEAILCCDRLNQESGSIVCTLDIYGPISEDYAEEFSALCEKYSQTVKYCGIVHPSESIATLKQYYMLLFPTLFYTEGIPGTIIDAFSAGVPVLASEWESCFDVVSERDSITYKFGDTEAFYEKLKYCVENPDIIDQYRNQCLLSAQKFSSENALKLIGNLLKTAEVN